MFVPVIGSVPVKDLKVHFTSKGTYSTSIEGTILRILLTGYKSPTARINYFSTDNFFLFRSKRLSRVNTYKFRIISAV